jgi:hypothetical protein
VLLLLASEILLNKNLDYTTYIFDRQALFKIVGMRGHQLPVLLQGGSISPGYILQHLFLKKSHIC